MNKGSFFILFAFQENEEENKRVAALRLARLQKEAEERKVRIQMELQDYDVKELERLEKVEMLVEKEQTEIENRIKEEDLVKAIETALANPVDYEYAIDLKGNIFRGRKTKCNKVKPVYYEKIPVATEN